MSDIENTSSEKLQAPTVSKSDACMITSCSTKESGMLAPSIENIIEEDEEEDLEVKVEPTVKVALEDVEDDQSSKSDTFITPENTPVKTIPNSKFKLEPVNLSDLNTDSSKATTVFSSNISTTTSTSAKLKPTTSDVTNSNSKIKSDGDEVEVAEIRVEEGYATKQMDEYFRQTIAAIKEELTKKLENKKEKNAKINNKQSKQTRQSFIYDSNSDQSEDDYDDVNETDQNENYDHDEQSIKTDECTCIACCCDVYTDKDDTMLNNSIGYKPVSSNMNYLYQHFLATTNKKPKRIDRINSWLVLIGCFLNQFIIEGLCYNYANLFSLIQKEYHITSKLIASLPFMFLIGFYLLIAPISLFLTKQYGTKRIAVAGTFISTASLLASSFTKDDIVLFSVFYGVLTGIGISLIYVPTVIATSKWFLKERLFVNSLNILSASFGAAIYPLISELILKKYGMFDTMLILSGVQLNCMIGSLLLKKHKASFLISKLNSNHRRKKENSNSNNTDNVNYTTIDERNKNTTTKTKSISSTHLLDTETLKDQNSSDFETVSVSNSSSTVNNYTLKQYWRKFVQTRKSQANAKKNLFHLIAEEKRKTRTLSKTSLEDGFVITTSNNLLAPNDDAHVIVSRRNQNALNNIEPQISTPSNSSRAASRFLTRIANSLRSLTHTNKTTTSSPNHSKLNVKLNDSNETLASKQIVIAKNANNSPKIPLMSVFNGPIQNNENIVEKSKLDTTDPIDIKTSNLANVFNNDQSNATTITSNITQQTNLDEISDSDDDIEDDIESVAIRKANITNKATKQMSRYLSYRNSLSSSMRGSLMELPLPEVKERENEHGECLSGEESPNENNTTMTADSGFSKKNKRKKAHRTNAYQNNDDTSTKTISNGHQNGLKKYKPLAMINLRRYISITDGGSFYNSPFNLEPVEFNLRNSLIKKSSDFYRKQQNYNKISKNSHQTLCDTVFFNYLYYLTSESLLKNSILLMLNISFFFVTIGICIPIIYLSEYAFSKGSPEISQTRSIYCVCVVGLMVGLGRIFSMIVYRVNASNPKNRIFSYTLTLLLNGLNLIFSTYLCDTLFSFIVFSATFGALIGFNLGLRSMVIYDIIGLEWSDDSLFFTVILLQSMGAFIGIPVAGLLFDITKSHDALFKLSGLCFLMASLIIMPGRKWRMVCVNSLKSLNKFYMPRRN